MWITKAKINLHMRICTVLSARLYILQYSKFLLAGYERPGLPWRHMAHLNNYLPRQIKRGLTFKSLSKIVTDDFLFLLLFR